MTKPQSLREELEEIVGGIDWMPELVLKDAVDRIMSAVEHRLPEKKHAPTTDGTTGALNRAQVLGYNQAISEVQSILKGE